MDSIEMAHLGKPSSHWFHDLFAVLDAFSPVLLPLEKSASKDVICAELKNTTEVMRLRSSTPKVKLLHQVRLARSQQWTQLSEIVNVLWVSVHHILGVMEARISFVLPNMN